MYLHLRPSRLEEDGVAVVHGALVRLLGLGRRLALASSCRWLCLGSSPALVPSGRNGACPATDQSRTLLA